MGDDEGSISAQDVHMREAAHRMKNHLALVAGMLRLQSRRIRPDDAPRQLMAMADRIVALAHLYDQLAHGADSAGMELGVYVEGLIARLRQSLQSDKPAEIRLDIAPCTTSAERTADLGLILTELVTNAWKHGRDKDGRLKMAIALRTDGKMGELSCIDEGAGLPPGYEEGDRLGLKIIRALVGGIGGKMTIASGPGGTSFAIRFPVG
jgi:two-component sensor histidine kinase